jgi:ribosomal protein S18 acetylase RimI-like enzyme
MQVSTISMMDLEMTAAGGWRAPQQELLGDWLLRAAEGFTGRANSALAAGDPGLPLAAAVTAVCAWYRARGLPPVIAVPFPLTGPGDSALDRLLASQGWPLQKAPAIVMTAGLRAIADQAGPADADESGPQPVVAAEPDEDWLACYHYRGQQLPPVARRLMLSAPWQAFASLREAGQTVAIGRVAAAGGWAGLTAIETDPAHRRRGLARRVTAALARVALTADVAAGGLYLQVEDGNAAARALYLSMGFAEHHRYHYRVAPAD